MMVSAANDGKASVGTREQAEVVERSDADELRARAARIRERSAELIAELGAGHPLVAQALEKAELLELEASRPAEIHLR